MVVFPNCKINLGLTVLNKREDGYHNIETIFFPLPLKDALEIVNNDVSQPAITFTVSGLPIQADPLNNLCVKAYYLLKEDLPGLPPIKMHLHKAIPMGAGLGGGSADAAFTLTLLNQKYELSLSSNQLLEYAARLGSDCPFFILNEPCAGTGRGEILSPVPVNLSGYQLLLIYPAIHVSTGHAFLHFGKNSLTGPAKNFYTKKSIAEVIAQPVQTWKEELINEFEIPVFARHPEIKKIKDLLYANGAIYASMSGSGSAVYGLFSKNSRPIIDCPANSLTRYFSF